MHAYLQLSETLCIYVYIYIYTHTYVYTVWAGFDLSKFFHPETAILREINVACASFRERHLYLSQDEYVATMLREHAVATYQIIMD